MEIVKILEKNLHLMYKSEILECHWDFMKHSLGYELFDNQKKNGAPNFYEYHYISGYPRTFDHYFEETLKILLKEQAEIVEESK